MLQDPLGNTPSALPPPLNKSEVIGTPRRSDHSGGSFEMHSAQGGSGYLTSGGLGAEMEAEFNFSTATTLTLLVGGAGATGYGGGGNGGGGGEELRC